MRNHTPNAAVIIFIVFACFGPCEAGDLEITLGIQRTRFEEYGFEGYYDEPLSRVINVTSLPFRFDVIIRNISGSAKPVYEEVDAGPESSVLIEMTGEDGSSFEMKEKPASLSEFDYQVNEFLNPGERKTIPVAIDPEIWENTPSFEPGKVKKYRMRVIYQNDLERIYSDSYEIILDGTSL
jgi:hypothetical protein